MMDGKTVVILNNGQRVEITQNFENGIIFGVLEDRTPLAWKDGKDIYGEEEWDIKDFDFLQNH